MIYVWQDLKLTFECVFHSQCETTEQRWCDILGVWAHRGSLPSALKGISACQVSFDMTGRRWASRESQQTKDGCTKWRDPSTLWIQSCAPHYAGKHEEMWDKKRDRGHVISEYEAFGCTRMDIWLLATSPRDLPDSFSHRDLFRDFLLERQVPWTSL